ncbi:MAG: hypothetical protein R3F34_19020 [Planctomycetota bacterium]
MDAPTERKRPTGWERPNAVGPWVCVANAVIAIVLLVWLLATWPAVEEAREIERSPWIDAWLRAAATTAVLLPASTLFLWRSCPLVPLPKELWPKGDATAPKHRFRRFAPRGAKIALSAMVVHALVLVTLPILVIIVTS